jgi:hypothetical protein
VHFKALQQKQIEGCSREPNLFPAVNIVRLATNTYKSSFNGHPKRNFKRYFHIFFINPQGYAT